MKFRELTDINENILKAIDAMGFEEMTQIQEQIVPVAVNKCDVIGQSQTGTGKTVAFGIPLIQNLDLEEEKIQSVIMTPTRELAIQVSDEINRLLKFLPTKAVALYGGEEITRQIKRLKDRPAIIVATPGRLMDHIRRRTVKTEYINTVVLDEADEMLSMGFVEDIEEILEQMPNRSITMLFSATMPDRIKKISEKFLKDPLFVKVERKTLTVDAIDQKYIQIQESEKFDALCRLLDIYQPPLCIIFGRTKRRVDELISGLQLRDYKVEGIHGDMKQDRREKVLERFKKGNIRILVATDVAARGLDISGVTHVINFDLPQEIEGYVHRIGRTGRAGKSGVSFTFVHPKEMEFLQEIEHHTKSKMEKFKNPTVSQAKEAIYLRATDKIVDLMDLDYEKEEQLEKIAQNLLERYKAVDIISAALRVMTKNDKKQAYVKLTSERPLTLSKKYRKNVEKRNNPHGDGKRKFYKKGENRTFDYKKDKKNRDGKRYDDKNHGSKSWSDKRDDRKKEYRKFDKKK